jgi:hypothetical protein
MACFNQDSNHMKTLLSFMGIAWGMAAALSSNADPNLVVDPNLLSDPGFESGMPVASAIGGWSTVVDASFSQTYAHSGAWSMENYYSPGGFHGVSYQQLAVTPGAAYQLSGWGFTPNTLGSSSFGSLILFFTDANGALLGQYLTSNPFTSASPANTWTQLSVDGTAPANAAYVSAETSLFDPGPGDALYFDDLSLTAAPEPSVLAVLSAGLGLGLLVRRRMRRAV